MDELTCIFHDVSDPIRLNSGNHVTRQDIIDSPSNLLAQEEVAAYLKVAAAMQANEESSRLITAYGTFSLWESVLNTECYSYSLLQNQGEDEDEDEDGENRGH